MYQNTETLQKALNMVKIFLRGLVIANTVLSISS